MTSQLNRLTAGFLSALFLLSACGSGTAATEASTEQTDPTTATVASLPERSESDEASTSASDVADSVKDASDGDAPTEELSPEEAQLKFQQCLEDAGIEDPFGGPGGEAIVGEGASDEGQSFALELDEADFEAFDKCNEILNDAFGEFTPSPEQEALIKDAELEFNQCMTDKGFDISGNGQGFELSGDISIDDLEAAASECDVAFDALNSELASEDGEDS